MQEAEATRIAEALRAYGLHRHTSPGPRRTGSASGCRSAMAARRCGTSTAPPGLEAQIMRDGVLVGFVPNIEGSESFDEAMTARAIATADYGT